MCEKLKIKNIFNIYYYYYYY